MPEPYAVRMKPEGGRTSYKNKASYLAARASLSGAAARRAAK